VRFLLLLAAPGMSVSRFREASLSAGIVRGENPKVRQIRLEFFNLRARLMELFWISDTGNRSGVEKLTGVRSRVIDPSPIRSWDASNVPSAGPSNTIRVQCKPGKSMWFFIRPSKTANGLASVPHSSAET